MSGRRSRSKGQRGEREAARLLREMFPALSDKIRRGWQARFGGKDEPDIVGLPFHVEVAVGQSPSPHGKMKQALKDTGGSKPILVMTRRDHDEWLLTFRLKDFRLLLDRDEEDGKT